MAKTDSFNSKYGQYCAYCSSCHYYAVPSESPEDKNYYANNYHSEFKYSIRDYKNKLLRYLPIFAFRSIARLGYLEQRIDTRTLEVALEIGGGTGETFWVFSKKTKIKQYTIIEPSQVMAASHPKLIFLNKVFGDVELHQMGKPDIVMMFHVLEHIYDLPHFFARLKQTGLRYLYLEVPNIDNHASKHDSLHNHPHYHHFSIKSLARLLEANGFSVISAGAIVPLSYGNGKKIPFFKKYWLRLTRKNESCSDTGEYIRVIAANKHPSII
jgi:hypothetical protein